ncbi:MAG: HK97 family phage prohead protease [Candidatus Midichloria sp.]|nr:MAG: HK97 family phage prohead protease [Candidatus Midichloria sp.]
MYNDCILPKAFSKNLFYSNKVNLLWEHDPRKIIGMAKAKEDTHRL